MARALAPLGEVGHPRPTADEAQQRIDPAPGRDALTGLPNRTAFTAELERLTVSPAPTGRRGISILLIDLDGFRDVNDVFGCDIGDRVLKEVARRLLEAAHGQFVARMGDDEFGLICRGPSSRATASALADRLLARVSRDLVIDAQTILVGGSIGIAVLTGKGATGLALLNHADAALYRAKRDGRGGYRVHRPDLDGPVHAQRLLHRDLRLSLARDEMVLLYQPQSTVAGVVTGFEALLRWNLPRLGVVMPSDFVCLAEESGLIVAIGEWILRASCQEAARWERPLQVSVNISPVQFRHGDLAALIQQILLETGLAPERLEIEITEGVLVDDFAGALALLRRIKALGVRVAIDDFGTGYSSLSYLHAFPFDKLKVDQSFIVKLETDEQVREIVRAVIGLCRSLNLPVVAEGVETHEQLAFLSTERCYGIQGFLIGKPCPIDDYGDLTGIRSVGLDVGTPASRLDTSTSGRRDPT